MKKTIYIILFCLITVIMNSCNKPELIVFNKQAITQLKTIQINDIEYRALTMDPYMEKDLNKLITFEFQKAGYRIIPIKQTTVSNQNQIPKSSTDPYINITLTHRRYYENIDEIENITISFDIYSLDNEKICSVLFSETAEERLLNTQCLQQIIAEMITTIKDID